MPQLTSAQTATWNLCRASEHLRPSLVGEERRTQFSSFEFACWFDARGEPSDEAIADEIARRARPSSRTANANGDR